jgi:hypothetical protein
MKSSSSLKQDTNPKNHVGRGGEVIRTTLADRTLEGTIAILLLGSLIPYTFAYLLFVSFAAVGGSILILLLAVLVVQAPFDVAVSDGLLKWLTTHDPVDFKIGDFAYAKVSSSAISFHHGANFFLKEQPMQSQYFSA